MSWFAKQSKSESSGILKELSQRWEMIRAAGEAVVSEHFKSVPTPAGRTRPNNAAKPMERQPQPTEVLNPQPSLSEIRHMAETADKLRQTPEAEVAVMPTPSMLQSETLPITKQTGLDIKTIEQDLNRIYGKQADDAPDISLN